MILLSLLIILAILSFCVGCYFLWLKQRYAPLNKIAGPTSITLLKSILFSSPENTWQYVRDLELQYPRLVSFWHTVHPVVMMSHRDDIEVVLSSMKHISKSTIYDALLPWLGTGLLTSTGSKWQHRRKILTPAFHFNILREFIDVFNENSMALVKVLESECAKTFTDVVPFITQTTLHSICETAMGIQLASNTETTKNYINSIYRIGEIIIETLIHPWLQVPAIAVFTPQYRRYYNLVKILHNFSSTVIKTRKQQFRTTSKPVKKRMALLDVLISIQQSENSIDDNGIREEVDTFMFEGHDTTTSCICFSLLCIANNFDVQSKIVKELKSIFDNSAQVATYEDLQNMTYLDKVLKECLRLYPSVPIISRVAEEDIILHAKYTIPRGTVLMFHFYNLHRNPEMFPDPEKFDPERFSSENTKDRHPFAYIPFSAGPRNCIGQRFAILEIKIVIASILRNFHLHPVDTPSDIKIGVHLILKSINGIKIKFEKRTTPF